MYKCPFCNSSNVVEVTEIPERYKLSITPMTAKDFAEQSMVAPNPFAEMMCNDCGMVSKVHPATYEKTH